MKRHEIVLFSVLLFLIALGAVVWATMPLVPFLFMMAMEPAGWGCDEGPFSDWRSSNARGDVIAGYIRACTAIGTVVDNSVALQPHGEEKWIKLIEHGEPIYHYPKFHWLDDDTLMIDLGKVSWIKSPVHKVGSVNISYVYSIGEP